MTVEEIALNLGINESHDEGGLYLEDGSLCTKNINSTSGTIYYYLGPNDYSEFHMMDDADEYWCHLSGASLEIWEFNPNTNNLNIKFLGKESGEKPVQLVKAGMIFGARHRKESKGNTLVSCITVPRFKDEIIYSKDDIIKRYPQLISFYDETIDSFFKERNDVANFMVRLYRRKLTTSSGGNVSVRLPGNCFCITASSKDKGFLSADDIAIVDFDGKVLTPNVKVSIETEMHRKIYLTNSTINSVIHAHPCYSSLLSATDLDVDTKITGESYYIISDPAYTKYERMGTVVLADAVSGAVAKGYRVISMANHGITAVGNSLLEAFNRIEVYENTAKMTVLKQILLNFSVNFNDLSKEECQAIIGRK